MRSHNAGAHSRAYHGADSTADRCTQDSSTTGAHAHFSNRALAVLIGHNVALALGLGIGAKGIDHLGMQMVTSAIRQNKFIRPEVDDRSPVQPITGGGVNHPAVQLRTDRDNDFAIAQHVLGDRPLERCIRGGRARRRYPAACEP